MSKFLSLPQTARLDAVHNRLRGMMERVEAALDVDSRQIEALVATGQSVPLSLMDRVEAAVRRIEKIEVVLDQAWCKYAATESEAPAWNIRLMERVLDTLWYERSLEEGRMADLQAEANFLLRGGMGPREVLVELAQHQAYWLALGNLIEDASDERDRLEEAREQLVYADDDDEDDEEWLPMLTMAQLHDLGFVVKAPRQARGWGE